MRNLKKILALVLALVMSMSLLTVANAFSDDESINETYLEAAEVLAGLKVLQGRPDGSFDPKANVNRGEMAAIIYRMVTTDVTDAQTSIYAESSKLSDVPGTWSAGYVGFCNNSNLIMGYPDGTFQQNKSVTGHEALAMLLRAIGYGKNGEFQGKDWAINTAIYAKSNGLLKNINESTLSQPATREMVAEMAFRAMLAENVNWSLGLNYQPNGKTLAQGFELEYVDGVVTANEWADLYDVEPMNAGETRLVSAEKEFVLKNVATELTDIGESRYAWVVGNECLYMADTGLNAIAETGDAMTVAKLAKDNGLRLVDTTERYNNFGGDGDYYSSEHKISYRITSITDIFSGRDADAAADAFEAYYGFEPTGHPVLVAGETNLWTVTFTGNEFVQIRPDEHIEETDMNCIREIFYSASKTANNTGIVLGEVYVGSQEWDDISDDRDMSYREFVKKYIETTRDDEVVVENENGNWLKIVDNNGDGVAEYVLKTSYVLDQISNYNKRTETFSFYSNLPTNVIAPVYLNDYEPEVGDVVLYAVIDGQALVELAETKVATIEDVNFRTDKITSTDGDEYEQSGIRNATGYADNILAVEEKVEYNLYMDKYGYLRAYNLVDGTTVYGLLTELYNTRNQNAAYVTSGKTMVELKAGEAKIDEFELLNAKGNDFIGAENWGTAQYSNWLQRAVAHLGLTEESAKFDYNSAAGIDEFTATNVAKYVQTEDGVKLYPVSEYAVNKAGEQLFYKSAARDTGKATLADGGDSRYPVYASDYVQLDIRDLAKGEDQFVIDANYGTLGNSNNWINAVNNTEYYLVQGDKITYFVGRANLPAIAEEYINAIYAVAQNTQADNERTDYWVANVVVIELDGWDKDYDSISLDYFTNKYHTGRTVLLNTLNSKVSNASEGNFEGGAKADVVPADKDWGASVPVGFYKLYDTTVDTETGDIAEIAATDVEAITKDFNAHGIYAGTINRKVAIDSLGQYIEIDNVPFYIENVPFYAIRTANGKNIAERIDVDEVETNDRVIWVETATGASFVVDVDFNSYNWVPADFLANTTTGLWKAIMDEQTPTGALKVEFFGVQDTNTGDDKNATAKKITIDYATAKAALADGKEPLKVTGAGVSYETLPKKVELKSNGDWKMIVTIRSGSSVTTEDWELKINAASNDNTLQSAAFATPTTFSDLASQYETVLVGTGEGVADYTARFKAKDANASVSFRFYDADGNEVVVSNGQNLTDTDAVYMKAFVVAEDNTEAVYVIRLYNAVFAELDADQAVELAKMLMEAGLNLTDINTALRAAYSTNTVEVLTAIRKAGATPAQIYAWNNWSKNIPDDVAAALKAAGDRSDVIFDAYLQAWAAQTGGQNDLSGGATLTYASATGYTMNLGSSGVIVDTTLLAVAAAAGYDDTSKISIVWSGSDGSSATETLASWHAQWPTMCGYINTQAATYEASICYDGVEIFAMSLKY